MKKIDYKSLIFNIFMPIGLSMIISLLLGDYSDKYDSLIKLFEVPSIVFPIVWFILYILMGISSYIIYEINTKESQNAYYYYWISLFINLLWPVFFFGFDLYLFSALWLILLVVIVIVVMIKFYQLNKVSFYLLIPYLLWLGFALVLNISIYILNS